MTAVASDKTINLETTQQSLGGYVPQVRRIEREDGRLTFTSARVVPAPSSS